MKLQMKIAMALGALALATAAAPALASQPTNPGHGNGQGNGPKYTPAPETPGPSAGLPEKAKAYGVYCQDQSKKHVAGEKGTPFSQCVTAMAKTANNEKLTPSKACKGMSRKHVKGEKGTPFSRCVSAAAKLRKAQQG
jgi:invasion protein IalB